MRKPGEKQVQEGAAAADAEALVIVETDATQRGYDPRLVELLREVEQGRLTDKRLPFPRDHGIAHDVLRRDYARTFVRPGSDAEWHFQLQIACTARVVTSGAITDGAGSEPTRLAMLQLAPAPTEIEILGQVMAPEVSLAGWLDEWVQRQGMTTISSRPRPTPNGAMGDLIAGVRTGDSWIVARCATVRHRRCAFMLALRTPLESYARVSSDFVLALSSFAPVG